VSTCILGFSRLEQIDENLKALDLMKVWSTEIEGKVNAILNNEPEADINFRDWAPFPSRRSIALKKTK